MNQELQAYIDELKSNPILFELLEPLFKLIQTQQELIEKQAIQIQDLTQEVARLKGILKQDSDNSSKPPSQDWKKNRKSNREKSDKKQGAQPGHEPNYLKMVEVPDFIEQHLIPYRDCSCGQDLSQIPSETKKQQVFDLPQNLKIEVTEHQIEVKTCSCGKCHKAIPLGSPTVYGERIKAFGTYLNSYQFLPYERIQDFFKDIFNHTISDGFLYKVIKKASINCKAFIDLAQSKLQQSVVVHVDETGAKADGKKQWVHVVSNSLWTYLGINQSRGKKAHEAMGFLKDYKGVLVHDRFGSYWSYKDCSHALCNAHLLRELRFEEEVHQRQWAKALRELLKDANKGKISGIALDRDYDICVAAGLSVEVLNTTVSGNRGRIKQSKGRLLVQAFSVHKASILRFSTDPRVPFDNNQAERDLRMVKLHQKISGCFRSETGAKAMCNIRSYISSIRKQKLSVWQGLLNLIRGDSTLIFLAQS